ncbi:Exopolysaccharide synthesis, ExoD [Posidoniimonas polymericola]|uniref:Exopolysaccharide synthesis, ExoD n=1 Tax=Posidoniimonas polymericola TaxID=2528002 RepID=A0A5C5YF91_9BACT|nr:exopolysaccharide biosynthesis protein [Posidoniimonas polymericola]TWT73589.1 Exopolysaccharide synthesis, ExoD [Posidoniimonas polymericola]
MAEQQTAESLTGVVDQLEDKAAEDGDLLVGDALEEFAGRLFGPLLMIPGLLVMTPVGGIPFVPTTMGVFIILVAGQSLFGRKHPWLPGIIKERGVDEEKFKDSMEKVRPWLKWVDSFTAERMTSMVTGPMKYVIAAVCILMACTMPPLELLPFACAIPGAAILFLGLAVTARDGLLAVFGLVASVGALGAVGYWMFS